MMLQIWKPLVFFIILGGSQAKKEGQVCNISGKLGTCVLLRYCPSTVLEIQTQLLAEECEYTEEPIVCCLNGTISRHSRDVASTSSQGSECPPILADLTAPKTGQKAWAKCIEYQEKLVYPCEDVPLNVGTSKARVNKCMHNTDQRVTGGPEAELHEFSHTVLLGYGADRNNIQWLCGGSVISERYILTAVHCLNDRQGGIVSYVFVGGHTRSEASDLSKVYDVKRIVKHPDFKLRYIYNDIALLELDRDIHLNQFIVPACLHSGDAVDDSQVFGSGWGRIRTHSNFSEVLKKVVLNKVPVSDCASKYPLTLKMPRGLDERTQICYAANEENKDMCPGDGGAPLQIISTKINCMYVVVSLTSVGMTCGLPNVPGIYTRVAPYVSWIESIVWP